MENNEQYEEFTRSFEHLMRLVHQNAEDHGFWDPGTQNWGSICSNIHREVSEIWEQYRVNPSMDDMSDKIPYAHVTEELADIVIRCMDIAARYQLELAGAILSKHEYNKTRPYRHNKKC